MNLILKSSALAFACSLSVAAQAGFLDSLNQVNSVLGAVAPKAAPVQQSQLQANTAQAVAMQNQLLAQSLASMDCVALAQTALTTSQQISALPEENEVSKAAGFLGKAGGLFASVGAAAGVDVTAIQKAQEVAYHANTLAANTATTSTAASQRDLLTQQLAGIQLTLQAKGCQ